MQYEPGAAELLAAIAEVLEEVLEADLPPALSGGLRHRCRVAANLTRILQREAELGSEAAARERDRLAALLGLEGDAVALSRALVERIRDDDSADLQRRAWATVVANVRDDLAIAKPGHDAWEGG